MGKRLSVGNHADMFYIINLIDGSSIYLNGLPDSISESVAARFEEVTIEGRSASYFGYSGTESPSFSFSVLIHDDYCPKGIISTVNYFKSLVYPAYVGRIIAPTCKVVLGRMVRFMAICESVDVEWQPPIRNGIYIQAEVSFSFKRVFKIAPSYLDVRNEYIGFSGSSGGRLL